MRLFKTTLTALGAVTAIVFGYVVAGSGETMGDKIADAALKYVGVCEVRGSGSNADINRMLAASAQCSLDDHNCYIKIDDKTAWCGAFAHTSLVDAEIPKALYSMVKVPVRAKDWLNLPNKIERYHKARRGDIVILHRGTNPAEGHVGILYKITPTEVILISGNSNDCVTVESFPRNKIAGIRRIK